MEALEYDQLRLGDKVYNKLDILSIYWDDADTTDFSEASYWQVETADGEQHIVFSEDLDTQTREWLKEIAEPT